MMVMKLMHDVKLLTVIRSMGRELTVPDWHEVYRQGEDGPLWEKVGQYPCIRLSPVGDEWKINTNRIRQTGLVCFLPEECLGWGILAVMVRRVTPMAVYAVPTEYIKFEPRLTYSFGSEIGREAEDVFSEYCEQAVKDESFRAVWCGKSEGEPSAEPSSFEGWPDGRRE